MSSSKTKLERWEHRLKQVFDEIDAELEAEGACGHYPRHPARPPAGATSNREDDGLFDLGAAFTVGIGSAHGPGQIHIRDPEPGFAVALDVDLRRRPETVLNKFADEVFGAALAGHAHGIDPADHVAVLEAHLAVELLFAELHVHR
jgi:hypothetical protein